MNDPLDPALRQLAQEIDDSTPPPRPWHELTTPATVPAAPVRVRRRRLALPIATMCIAIGGIVAAALAIDTSEPRGGSFVAPMQSDPTGVDPSLTTIPPESTEPDGTLTSAPAPTSFTTLPPPPSPPPSPTPPAASIGGEQSPDHGAPAFLVDDGSGAVTIDAGSYCIPGICADGVFDPTTFHEFAASDHLVVTTPSGWPLTATFRRHGEQCAASQQVMPVEASPGVFRIDPAGVAGTYDVTLFAQGRADAELRGDASTTVVWTTTEDGPLATPAARVAVLADHDGAVDSYGVELSIENMAIHPAAAEATIVVTSAEGASMELRPTTGGRGPDCPDGVTGSLYFTLDATTGRQAAALGTAPFRYDVTLVLDGVTYAAHATWPADEMSANGPSVDLQFDPPLPSLAAALLD